MRMMWEGRQAVGPVRARMVAITTTCQAPLAHAGVVAGEEHLGHLPAAVLGGPRVVRILGRAVERGRKGLLDAPSLSGRARRAASG